MKTTRIPRTRTSSGRTTLHNHMKCCEEYTCALCHAKYVNPTVAKAHQKGVARLPVPCVVMDTSVHQDDRTLTSKIFPLFQAARRGKSVFVGNSAHLTLVARLAKFHGLVLCSGTLQRRPPKPVGERLKAAGGAGLALNSLSAAERAAVQTLSDAHVCATSKAVFKSAAATAANLTVADVLLRTSKVFIYQHGPTSAASAAVAPCKTAMGSGPSDAGGLGGRHCLRNWLHGSGDQPDIPAAAVASCAAPHP